MLNLFNQIFRPREPFLEQVTEIRPRNHIFVPTEGEGTHGPSTPDNYHDVGLVGRVSSVRHIQRLTYLPIVLV